MKYFYNPTTGEFLYRGESKIFKPNLPYIETTEPFVYSNYRVDLETGELIYEPKTQATR